MKSKEVGGGGISETLITFSGALVVILILFIIIIILFILGLGLGLLVQFHLTPKVSNLDVIDFLVRGPYLGPNKIGIISSYHPFSRSRASSSPILWDL